MTVEKEFLATLEKTKKNLESAEAVASRGLAPFDLMVNTVTNGKMSLVAFQNLINSEELILQVNLNYPVPTGQLHPVTNQPVMAVGSTLAAVFKRTYPLPDTETLIREFLNFMQAEVDNPNSILCSVVAMHMMDKEKKKSRLQIPGR